MVLFSSASSVRSWSPPFDNKMWRISHIILELKIDSEEILKQTKFVIIKTQVALES